MILIAQRVASIYSDSGRLFQALLLCISTEPCGPEPDKQA
jgi:hypothetical protein